LKEFTATFPNSILSPPGLSCARIERSINRLLILPMSGRPSVKGTRLLAVPRLPYVVVHRVAGDVIDIIAVLHTSRRRRS
jgi:plasmid stabilization system protein ParE